jgi:hypothetical protein
MNIDKLTKRSRALKTKKGLKEIADALDDEFGAPGITRLAMSLLTNYRYEDKNYVDTFHRYLKVLRSRPKSAPRGNRYAAHPRYY